MNLEELQSANSSKLVSFDRAEIHPGFVNDTFFLVVAGEAPCLNMDVRLVPLIYIQCPEYWGIEVVGTLPGGFCLDAIKPFVVSIPLTGITGSEGIEVIGANRSERLPLGGGCTQPGNGSENG